MKIPSDPRSRILLAVAAFILLSVLLSWTMPILKLLIALGVAWLAWNTSNQEQTERRSAFFSSDSFRASGFSASDAEESGCRVCRYVLSNASLDLTDSSSLPDRMEIQSAFSSVSIRLPVDANITLHASGAFCSISMPGCQSTVFGERTCHCGTQDPLAPRLHIDVASAFASVSFHMG